ncbi:hypothetical protein [Hyphobacterium marinum]|uniref:Tetratricopeptide repeat protein n=1 Tax=Hyphobacterium marinum TaxID=3116574 RepID=A0ABU7LZT3_9PROT|nr:hypothetical protein [Hyphobacterium sp. Y6023]MEE2567058.1 hypothetical protein [Hyphobacterium sp. Y6023]
MARKARHTVSLTALALALSLAGGAFAQEPVTFEVEQIGDVSRIRVVYPEASADDRPSAEIEAAAGGQVLIARFSEPIEGNVQALLDELGGRAAMARIDPDGRALRFAMTGAALQPQVSSSYNIVAIDLVPAGASAPPRVISLREQREIDAAAAAAAAPPPPPPEALAVAIEYGQASEYTRIEFVWPEDVDYTLSQNGETATIVFSRPAEMDLAPLRASPPRLLETLQGARGDNDYTLVLTLDPEVSARAWREDNRIVVDLLDPSAADAAQLLSALATLNEAAETAETSGAQSQSPDNDVESADSTTPLATDAPLEDPADVTAVATEALPVDDPVGDPVDYAELDVPQAGDSETGLTLSPPEVRADPVPADGEVRVAATEAAGDLVARFDWAGPVGAAVFRRGEAIWIVFDAEASLDLSEIAHGSRGHVTGFETYRGDGYSAARVVTPRSTNAEVRQSGNAWTVVFSEAIDTPPRPATVQREARPGSPARITVTLEGAQHSLWIDDPVVGDRLAVITALAPIEGISARRDFMGAAILPSAHGAAAETAADDLTVTLDGQEAVFARPDGLALSPTNSGRTSLVRASAGASPAFVDVDAWRGAGDFWANYARLERLAAPEDAPARVAFARFLIANELAPEALGVLATAIDASPAVGSDPHVNALIGVASLMMGRVEDARAAFSQPVLMADTAAAPWRALIAVEREEWEEASRRFEQGRESIYDYTPAWRARFRVANALTALELNDFTSATEHLRRLGSDAPDEHTAARAEWIGARIDAANGDVDRAMRRLTALGESGFPDVEARALFELYRLQLDAGDITAHEGAEALEMLRYRWRGDDVELDSIRLLGSLYIREGAFAQGLEAMSNARARFPDSPASRRIGVEMSRVFRRLFLNGEADRMDPIEAVALFYEYSHLTPIGADGDRMIRRLADRLVAFDLLDPAAQLLRHQVDSRLHEPSARASVATDLAVIYLMDRRPGEALNLLRATRVAGLPAEMVAQRRLLEARAHAELERYDHALELVENDSSETAVRLRADVAWDRRDWPDAGRRLEAALGNRWSEDSPLQPSEQTDILRAAIAYNLAGERSNIVRLRERYGAAMAATDQAAAFSVLTSDATVSGDARVGDLARQVADIDTLDAFMDRFRERFAGGA